MDNINPARAAKGVASTSEQLQKGTDLYAQLEVMMGAIRNESAQLAAAKEQVTQLEQKNKDFPKLMAILQLEQEQNACNTRRLNETEIIMSQLRADMQRLNDIYSKERKLRSDLEIQKQRLDHELNTANQNIHRVTAEVVRLRDQLESQKKEIDETNYKFALEKNDLIRNLARVTTELEESEKAKKEVSLHFWNIKQDTQKLKDTLVSTVNENAELKMQLSMSMCRSLNQQEGLLMFSEDQRSDIMRLKDLVVRDTDVIKMQQIEMKQLYQAIQIQESQSAKLSKQLSLISGETQRRVDEVETERARLTRLLDSERISGQELTKEIEYLKEKTTSTSKLEISKQQLEAENDRLKVALKSKEDSLVAVELSLSQLIATREQELLSFASDGSFIEQLESQLRASNEAKWAVEKEFNDKNKILSDDLATAKCSVEDCEARINSMKNEKERYEKFMKQEIQHAGQLGTVLKNELELRLEELSQTRKDRDAMSAQVEELTSKVAELNITIGRSDAQFREILESDRAKVAQDLRIKSNRCRTLEAEKQELLAETSSLMKQAHEHQLKRDTALAQMERSAQELLKAHDEIDSLEGRASDLTKDLKAAQRREKQMADEFAAKEQEFRHDVAKLDSVIKASAKSATSQVAEMSEKIRILVSTSEEQKLRIASLESAGKKAMSDLDRRTDEMKILKERHEASVQQITAELTTVRRDLLDTRQRVKLGQDENSKKEREIISLQTDINKIEAELHKYRERLRDAENRGISAGEQISSHRREIDNLSTELRRAKASLADQDQVLIAKQRIAERAERELKALEQEGFTETKKLRIKLKEVIAELDGLKESELPRMRKELEDATSAHSKLQSSNSATINGLIAEVNATEDALTKERRARESEASQYQTQMRELQFNLEKAQNTINDFKAKISAETTEKSSRFIFIEEELERMKSVISQRDERIADLEKQQQAGRVAMQGLRDTQAYLENSLSEARRALENESSSRLSLEDTIKRLRRHNSDSLHDSDIAKSVNDDSREKSSLGRGSDYETKRNPSDRASVRPMSPIDIHNGAGSNDEDEDYTRETAISSLSETSSWYPSPYKDKNSSEASPISISEAKRRDRSKPDFRMSPVEEGIHGSPSSLNTRSVGRGLLEYEPHPSNTRSTDSFSSKFHKAIVEEVEPPGATPNTKSVGSFPERLLRSVKFNAVPVYEGDGADKKCDPIHGEIHEANSGGVDMEAEDMINRTQLYLQQRLASKNKRTASVEIVNRSSYGQPPAASRASEEVLGSKDGDAYACEDDINTEIEEDERDDEKFLVNSDGLEDQSDSVMQTVVRRKKNHSLKKTKKRRAAPKIEFVGQPGNFHIQSVSAAASMQTSASADNMHFPHISSGK